MKHRSLDIAVSLLVPTMVSCASVHSGQPVQPTDPVPPHVEEPVVADSGVEHRTIRNHSSGHFEGLNYHNQHSDCCHYNPGERHDSRCQQRQYRHQHR